MKLKQFEHSVSFEEEFTVKLRGEVIGQPLGWGTDTHYKSWLEESLFRSIKNAVERYYQAVLLGTSIEFILPAPKKMTTTSSMNTEERLDSLLNSPLVKSNKELAFFRHSAGWTLHVGNPSRSVNLGEVEAEHQFAGETLDQCLLAAETDLLPKK